MERFHRSTLAALAEGDLRSLRQARELFGEWVTQYNETRLHAALGYLARAEYYRGDPAARQRGWAVKLERALERRRQENQERRQAAV
jgi:putative transposase